jgi:hypothetical protein
MDSGIGFWEWAFIFGVLGFFISLVVIALLTAM